MFLTKAQIIQGTRYVKTIQMDGLGGMLQIRPLSDGEATRIETDMLQNMIKAGIPIGEGDKLKEKLLEVENGADNSSNLLALEMSRIAKERDWETVACGLSIEEKWTSEEVRQAFVSQEIEFLAKEIDLLTRGVPDQAEKFRPGERGAESEAAGPAGVPAGGEDGGLDPTPN